MRDNENKNQYKDEWIDFFVKYDKDSKLNIVYNKEDNLPLESKEGLYRYLLGNIGTEQQINLYYHTNKAVYKSFNPRLHLKEILTIITNAYKELDREFPLLGIVGYIIGFISVIFWVGFGYFANAISMKIVNSENNSKLNIFLSVLAGLIDTAAYGFVIYSLTTGVAFFSIPVIIAASVSLLLRIIFAVCLGNQIYEVKKQVKEMTEFDQTSSEIKKYIEDHTPKTEEPKKEENNKDENKNKPKEEMNGTDKDKNNNDIPMGTGE